MITEKIKTYEKTIDKNIIKYGLLTDNYSNNITNFLNRRDKLEKISANEKFSNWYNTNFLSIVNKYDNAISQYKNFARKTTVPINWPYYYYLKLKRKFDSNVLFAQGVHFMVALQGGGKSTLAFEIIERLRIQTRKASYVNADFELPKQDPISKKFYRYHNKFRLLDFFDLKVMEDNPDLEVAQLKKFNRYFENIILDEWLTEMNHRLNRTKDYNNTFLALITMIAHMRHQKMKRIYVLSQIDNTDTQLLSMFKYQHEIEIDLDISYADWLATGEMSNHIKGWNIWTYGTKRNRKRQSNDKVLIKKQYLHKTADFSSFDTLSQASKYETLPEDNLVFI